MALVKKKTSQPINYTSEIAAKIQQRRLQILVHSYLYYERDMPVVADYKFDLWAKELVKLQSEHADIADKVMYADAFKNFDGTTGFDLPFNDALIVKIAMGLIHIIGRKEVEAEKEC